MNQADKELLARRIKLAETQLEEAQLVLDNIPVDAWWTVSGQVALNDKERIKETLAELKAMAEP